jgi:CRISPR system Cascade subunit CasC
MVGTQEFNSACFYRYANIDLNQLEVNLQADHKLALSGARAFLESFIMAIPKAKQNGTAAQSLPSFVMIVVRDKGLASLANAFARPVDGRDKGLVANSVEALARYWGQLTRMYGTNGVRSAVYTTMEDVAIADLDENSAKKVGNVEVLVNQAMSALGGGQ